MELEFESLPDWLLVKTPHSVPTYWVDVINDFLQVIASMFVVRGRETVLVHMYNRGDRLLFEVDYPSHFCAKKSAVDVIRQVFSQMSIHAHACLGMSDDIGQKVRVFKVATGQGANVARHPETAERIKATVEKIKQTGEFRPLKAPPRDWVRKLEMLRESFPNFASVIDLVVAPHMGILAKGGYHRQSPMLLVGPPGIGKTHFANALASTMGLHGALFINIAEETNAASLGGSSVFWANSAPGKLFELLAWGDGGNSPVANPLVILDELDKPTATQYNPVASLYTLLEGDTASRFVDQGVPDVVLDASSVRFVATANDASLIPEPLLGRMVVFHIAHPTAEQLRGVVRAIYADLIDRTRLPLKRELPDVLIDAAKGLNPREAKMRMECAIAKAVSAGRDCVRLSDWPDFPTAASHGRRSIGFTG
jgi:ATP-dependent Lon protease